MEATITLPNGKELEFTKGQAGVEKLFLTVSGELVVVYGDHVAKFCNMPVVINQSRKASSDVE